MTDQTPEATTEGLTPTDDAEMGALFDRLTADGVEDDPGAEAEAPAPLEAPAEAQDGGETAEVEAEAEVDGEEAEKAPAAAEAPHDLPREIRDVWGSMTPEAQQAVHRTQRELASRMAEQGRVVQIAKPVYDRIIGALQEIPEISDMTPAQLAEETLQLAKTRAALKRDPVGTLLDVAQHYGAVDALRARLAGEAPTGTASANIDLVNEVRRLEQQLARNTDPSRIDERINTAFAQRTAEAAVSQFMAAHKDTWDAVQGDMMDFIPIAAKRLGAGASDEDVLAAAYSMAIDTNPDLRAKARPPAKPQAQPDPERTAAQVRAKSVNVTSKSSGNPKPLTDHQKMEAVWDRAVQP